MYLRIVENGKFKEIEIKEGELFLLPGTYAAPHCPILTQPTRCTRPSASPTRSASSWSVRAKSQVRRPPAYSRRTLLVLPQPRGARHVGRTDPPRRVRQQAALYRAASSADALEGGCVAAQVQGVRLPGGSPRVSLLPPHVNRGHAQATAHHGAPGTPQGGAPAGLLLYTPCPTLYIRGGDTCAGSAWSVHAYQNDTVATHKHHFGIPLGDLRELHASRTLMDSAPVSSATCTS